MGQARIENNLFIIYIYYKILNVVMDIYLLSGNEILNYRLWLSKNHGESMFESF